MLDQPSSLAEGFASLRRDVAAQPRQGWMPAPVHALILACLQRIFARLEEILRAWQEGTLTPPPIHTRPVTPRPVQATRPQSPSARWLDWGAWRWPWSPADEAVTYWPRGSEFHGGFLHTAGAPAASAPSTPVAQSCAPRVASATHPHTSDTTAPAAPRAAARPRPSFTSPPALGPCPAARARPRLPAHQSDPMPGFGRQCVRAPPSAQVAHS